MMLLIVCNALAPYQPNLRGTLSSSSWSVLSSGASPSLSPTIYIQLPSSDNMHQQHIMLQRTFYIQHSLWIVEKDQSFWKNIQVFKSSWVSCPTVFLNKQESTSLLRRQSSEFPLLKGRTKHFVGNFRIIQDKNLIFFFIQFFHFITFQYNSNKESRVDS